MSRPKRDRKALDLTVLNLELETESYRFLKAIAKAKEQSMAAYVDDMLKRKIERLREKASRVIQNEENPC